MFNKLILFIGFLLQRERQLEGYNQITLVWSGQQGRVDTKGHTRTTARRSALAYILRKPELRSELQRLFTQVHGLASDFNAAVDGFYTRRKGLTGKALAAATAQHERACALFEAAFQQLPVPADAGWNFMMGSKSHRLLAAYPGGSDDFETDEFLSGVEDLLTTNE